MSHYDSVGDLVKREVIRSLLERTQSMNLKAMMSAFGASEPAAYEDVEETLNVPYVNREEAALAMDIFKPKAAEDAELPVIVVIHGGGLFMGDRGMNRPYCRLLAHKGYLVFSLEYRLAPKANLCQQLDDVCAGMDYVGQLLVKYEVDFRRIFLIADSAGAYLASYVSAMHESRKLQDAIGYKPSRMVYAAVGFLSGMFYTNQTLQEQIYGDRRNDPAFLKYMHIEHPEIIQNIPPAFLVTSCGDVFNNYSIRFNKALKKGGRKSHLLFIGDEELQHIFPIMKPEHPKSIEATDRMLAWFEEQARERHEHRRLRPETRRKLGQVQKRIEDGGICRQKVWANIRERIQANEELLERTAVMDCTGRYTYEQMFEEWTRYARVFSALGICSKNGSRAALCGVNAAEPLFALFGLNMTGAEVSLFPLQDFRRGGAWKAMLEKEGITDLIVSDIMVTPEIREEIERVKKKAGLRNVIYIHSLMGGPTIGPAELVYNEVNYHMLRQNRDVVFLNELLRQYEDAPVFYDPSAGEKTAFILHAPGTARGGQAFTDQEISETPDALPWSYRAHAEDVQEKTPLRVLQVSDCSSLMTLGGQVFQALMSGDTLVLTYFGFVHPKFIRAIDYYNVDVMLLSGAMVDRWLEGAGSQEIDFSSLKAVILSDASIPPEKRAAYREFFKAHGCRFDIITECGRCGEDDRTPAEDSFGYFDNCLPKAKKDKRGRVHFQMPEIPDSVMKAVLKYGNRLAGVPVGRKQIDHDFEE